MRSVNKLRTSLLQGLMGLCATCWLNPAAWAQAAFSIDSAVAHALSQNAGMAQVRASVAGKQEDLAAAQRMDWPTLKMEATALRGKGKPTSFSAVAGQQDPDTPTSKEITGNYGLNTLVLSAPIFQNGAFVFRQ
ncbi:MAG: hypothetical protein Q7S51_08725, partial [Gallionellaceae bacterium]|nr:hypothetical protein [Gallionellaceae bacterium]